MGEQKIFKKGLLKDSKLWQKIKSIKHLQIYIAIALGIIIVLIYFSTFGSAQKTTGNAENGIISSYVSELEYRLGNVLSDLKGAGNISVMITLESYGETIIAEKRESKTITNGDTSTTTVTSEPIMISSGGSYSPIVLSEGLPKIKGVIVISNGASDAFVRLRIVEAVQTLLSVSSQNIQVFEGV